MKKKYPIRPNSHNLEELSRRYFESCLPDNWTAYKPPVDYGVDLHVDIFEGNSATGLELLVQLKASKRASINKTETINGRIANIIIIKIPVCLEILPDAIALIFFLLGFSLSESES